MRTGQVCGLTWDDIDFEKETINIQHMFMINRKMEKVDGILELQKQKQELEKFI